MSTLVLDSACLASNTPGLVPYGPVIFRQCGSYISPHVALLEVFPLPRGGRTTNMVQSITSCKAFYKYRILYPLQLESLFPNDVETKAQCRFKA